MPTPIPKVLVCLFAHPDDEAFGPGGAIAHFSKICDVHIVCVTDGGAGRNSNPESAQKLAEIRKSEFINSTNILGVKSVDFLDYPDGSLNNNLYHQIADKIKTKLDILKPDTLLTFNLNGVSGHLDHVAVAMISSYLWERLDYVKNIMYFSEKKAMSDQLAGQYFIYFPPGLEASDTDLALDVSDVFDIKLAAMQAHVSQKEDYEMIRHLAGDHLKTEYFKIMSKN